MGAAGEEAPDIRLGWHPHPGLSRKEPPPRLRDELEGSLPLRVFSPNPSPLCEGVLLGARSPTEPVWRGAAGRAQSARPTPRPPGRRPRPRPGVAAVTSGSGLKSLPGRLPLASRPVARRGTGLPLNRFSQNWGGGIEGLGGDEKAVLWVTSGPCR